MAKNRTKNRLTPQVVCEFTDREDSGVHLDESSSPVRKHFDDDWDDIVNKHGNPKHSITATTTPSSATTTTTTTTTKPSTTTSSSRFDSTNTKPERWKYSKPTSPPPSMTAQTQGRRSSEPKSAVTERGPRHYFSRSRQAPSGSAVRGPSSGTPNVQVVHASNELPCSAGPRVIRIPKTSDNKYNLRPPVEPANEDNDDNDGSVNTTSVSATLVEEDEGLGIKDASGDTFNLDTTPEGSESDAADEEQSVGANDSSKKDKKDTKKRRFRKLLSGPLRRSHSAGCEKDLQVPAHALFLQYDVNDKEKECPNPTPSTSERLESPAVRMVHKTSSADAAMMAQEEFPGDSLPKSKSKTSIAKNVKRKIQAMRRRNTDSALVATFIRLTGSSVSRSQAYEWANDLETLINDKSGVEMFRTFLKSEFSDENLDFWLACEHFKTVKTNKLASTAQQIYTEFVAVKSPKEVNLDSKTRLEVQSGLENPTRTLFNAAQKRIQLLMEKDPYPRFLESDVYKHLVKARTQDV